MIYNFQYQVPTPLLALRGASSPPPPTDLMLLENGNGMELEDGSGLMILES
jgi:hypothetical protein